MDGNGRDVFEGRDLDEALHGAAEALHVPAADLRYEILDEGRRGVLGLGVKNVRIRVLAAGMNGAAGIGDQDEDGRLDEDRGADSREAQPSRREVSEEVVADVEATMRQMLERMGMELDVRSAARGSAVVLELDGPDSKALLARRGELLAAFQFLLPRMGRRKWPGASRIRIECGGGTAAESRDDEIVEMAREVAQQVARTGKTRMLKPLNSYERRLVHLAVREFVGLTSSSDGEGSLKCVRISKVRNTVA